MSVYPKPPSLRPLLDSYEGRSQGAAVYDPERWVVRKLNGLLDDAFVRAALEREDATEQRQRGRRSVTRPGINAILDVTDLDDDDEVLSAWLLVQAWGNGMNSRWGWYNTAAALRSRDVLLDNLRRTAVMLRGADDTSALADAHRAWKPGTRMGEAFFTKWFAFAGRRDGRPWQPLILDENVWRSLNRTLDVTVSELAGTKKPEEKYRAYVEAVHQWAGSTDRAHWVEWVLFANDGRIASA